MGLAEALVVSAVKPNFFLCPNMLPSLLADVDAESISNEPPTSECLSQSLSPRDANL